MGDGCLCAGNGGTEEKMSSSKGKVVLVVAWEAETEGGSRTVCCEVDMVDEATAWFFVSAVEVRCRVGDTHSVSEVLTSEGLAGVAEGAKRPAAVRSAREAVELVSGCKCEHDGEWIRHEVLHDGIADGGVRMLIHRLSGEKVVGVFEGGKSMMDVGGDEEAVPINLLCVV